MGFLVRCILAIGIIYGLSPKPEGYGGHDEAELAKNHAADLLSALTHMDTQPAASRDDIAALVMKARQALTVLDHTTRSALIEQYVRQDQRNQSILRGLGIEKD